MDQFPPSQIPFRASSPDRPEGARGERMLHQFPRAHVINIGGGTIGPIYITRIANGEVVFAEAKLYSAPFKHMIIDSSDLLRMFKHPKEPIDFGVFNHPWPEFHLVPKDQMKFEIARLERAEYVRTTSKLGHLLKGHPYASAMKVTPPGQAPRSKSQVAAPIEKRPETELQGTRHSERMASRIPNNHVPSTSKTRVSSLTLGSGSPSSSAYFVATKLDSCEISSITSQLDVLKQRIFNLLPQENRPQYEWVLTTGLKRQGKEGEKFRVKLAGALRALMRAQGARGKELQTLHNQYAALQRRLERRWPFHLPHIDSFAE